MDEQAVKLGGVDVVGELPEQPTPLTECWYIIESPMSERGILSIIQSRFVKCQYMPIC